MRKFKVFINHISVNIYAFLLQNSHSYPRLSEGVWNILDKPIHALLESFWILKHIWPHEFWVRDLRRIIDIYWLSKRKYQNGLGEFSKQCALGAWGTCFALPSLWFSCVHMYLCVSLASFGTEVMPASEHWLEDISVLFLCFVMDFITRDLLFFESWKEYTLNWIWN